MAVNLEEIFNEKMQHTENIYIDWSKLQNRIIDLLDSSESDEIESIKSTSIQFDHTVQHFVSELSNPQITLATTGTTSGGKSSLVNLLCGAEIMPVAVQEMSAGTVFIDHHPTKRTLNIPPVAGLPDEYSGEWANLTDDEIRMRLKQVMDGYRQLREENREPAAPCINIQYPTRLGMLSHFSGLPSNFRLRIIDLPGFKHIADDHNRDIIRNEVKPALCLVTYNSGETDQSKQKKLLEEVVEQVKALRGSPARMLFILNRIDVFRIDADSDIETDKFILNTISEIKRLVGQALPEHSEQISKLQAQPLSTLPALHAYLALSGPFEIAINSIKFIDKQFNSLIPEDIIEELPRKIANWEEFQRKRVADAVWKTSFGDSFDTALKKHIQDNIPQLLLPHLIKSVVDAADEAFTNVHQIINAHLNATQERYQKECTRLTDIENNLQKLRYDSRKELLSNLELINIESVDDVIELLDDIQSDLQQRYDLPKDSLIPLYDWSLSLGRHIQGFLLSIDYAIEKSEKPQGAQLDMLPPKQRQKIFDVLDALRVCGYTKYAKNAGTFEARDQQQENQLKTINQKLNEFADILAESMKWLLDRAAEQEADRIQEALQLLIGGYAQNMSEKVKYIAPDILGLSITPSNLTRVKQRLLLHFNFTAGFDISVKDEQIQNGYKQVKVGEKGIWYTLWIKKEPVYKKVPNYKKRIYNLHFAPWSTKVCNLLSKN